MLTTTQSEWVENYLATLDSALGDTAPAERREIVAGVREHIETALSGRTVVTDAEVDEVLRALGDPLAIAAETAEPRPSGPDAGATTTHAPVPMLERDWVPAAVVACLSLGVLSTLFFASFGGIFLIPILLAVGWLMLWLSPLWTPWEKLAGTFLLPAPGPVVVMGGLMSWSTQSCISSGTPDGSGDGVVTSETCTDETGVSVLVVSLLVAVVVASVITAIVIYRRGRRRAMRRQRVQIFSTGA